MEMLILIEPFSSGLDNKDSYMNSSKDACYFSWCLPFSSGNDGLVPDCILPLIKYEVNTQ